MRKAFVVLLVALYLSACGGGGDSPTTTPSTNTGSFTLIVRAARSPQDLIIGAMVVTEDSRVFITDGNGAVPLNASDSGKILRIT
ncbi:MAG: hypothetical protein NUV65_06985, partial [Candidatus Roizmanbacteria bacterium]|nr:hypothetical protein [Candidatus Roizmanbacteria bacterium]